MVVGRSAVHLHSGHAVEEVGNARVAAALSPEISAAYQCNGFCYSAWARLEQAA